MGTFMLKLKNKLIKSLFILLFCSLHSYATDVKNLRSYYLESVRDFYENYKGQRQTYSGVCSGLTKRDGESNYILGVSSCARIYLTKEDISESDFRALQKMSRSRHSKASIIFSAVLTEVRGGVYYFNEISGLKLNKTSSSNKKQAKKKTKKKAKKKSKK